MHNSQLIDSIDQTIFENFDEFFPLNHKAQIIWRLIKKLEPKTARARKMTFEKKWKLIITEKGLIKSSWLESPNLLESRSDLKTYIYPSKFSPSNDPLILLPILLQIAPDKNLSECIIICI